VRDGETPFDANDGHTQTKMKTKKKTFRNFSEDVQDERYKVLCGETVEKLGFFQ